MGLRRSRPRPHTRKFDLIGQSPPVTVEYLDDILGVSDGVIRRQYGGKAHGLVLAARAGAVVPPTLCLSTEPFVRATRRVASRGVDSLEELRRALIELEPFDDTVTSLRSMLDGLFADPPFSELNDRRLAIRSSAVAEDRSDRSFAGQFDSALDVPVEEDAVWRALCSVWAGAFDPEVLTYNARIRVDTDPVEMAVIIQPVIESAVGGVLFTRDPSSEGSDPLATVADSPRSVVDGAAGTTWRLESDGPAPLTESDAAEPPLENERADSLRNLARTMEASHDSTSGLDIEWAVSTGAQSRLWVLQSRPITASGRASDPTESDDQPEVWSNANVGEALPGVATPLTWSIIGSFSRDGFEQAFGAMGLDVPEDADLVGSFRGRVYLNLTEFVDIASGLPFLDASILYEMAGGGGVDLLEEQIDEVPSAEFVTSLPATLPKIAASQLGMPTIADVWMRYFDLQVTRHFELDLDQLDRSALRDELDDIDRLFNRNGRIMLSASSNFLVAFVAMRLFVRWFARESLDERELIGALEVSSAEPGIELLELARRIRRHADLCDRLQATDPDDAPQLLRRLADGRGATGGFVSGETQNAADALLDDIESFRRRFGHRAPGEAELSTPRWREESGFLWHVLLGYLRSESLPNRSSLESEREQRRVVLGERIDDAFSSGLRETFRWLWQWTRRAARTRESLRDCVVESLDLYRSIALETGRRLSRQGRLRDRDDVFYLRHDEMAVFLSADRSVDGEMPLRVRALTRKAICEFLRDLPDPPNTFVRVGNELVAEDEYAEKVGRSNEDPDTRNAGDSTSPRDVISGLSAHAGRVEGKARVIRDPTRAELEPGEILIAPRADVGWTPLFLTASAVVMELGGPLSHAAIVAREYGIPTIVNATGVIDSVETGDHLVVDATAGRVEVFR